MSLSFSFLAFSSLTSLRRGEAARACLSRLLRIFFAGEVIVESVKPAVAVAGREGPPADLFSPAERSAVTCDDFSRRARETFFLLEDGEETRTRGRPGDLGDFDFSGEAGEDAGGLRARGRRFFRGTHPATTLSRSIFFDVLTASDDAFCGVRLPEFRDAFLFAMFSELILECQEPVRRRAVVCVELQVRDWCPRVCHALLLRGKTSRYVRVRSAVVCRALLANEWAAQLSRKRQKPPKLPIWPIFQAIQRVRAISHKICHVGGRGKRPGRNASQRQKRESKRKSKNERKLQNPKRVQPS